MNVTVTGNTSEGGSDGINNDVELTLLSNTIVSGNGDLNCGGTVAVGSLGYNLEDADDCGLAEEGDQPNTDAMLGALSDNGGPTETHALLTSSPAIDTGDGLACPDTDQRGVARPQDGDNDGTAGCDIGAFELEGAAPPTPTPPILVDDGGSFTATVSDSSPQVGDTVEITVNVTDVDGNPAAGGTCDVAITSQPGGDASLEAATVTTDDSGNATVGLSVGSTPGVIEVTVDCGVLGSEVLEVTVGAAGLPPVGGARSSSSSTTAALALAIAMGALLIGAGFALSRE
jgi:hypothetical protein